MAVEEGKKVTFHFTLTVDKKVIQTSEGKEPMSYTHGSGQIIPGLAAEIEGMNEGEDKTIMVSAQDAYGEANPPKVFPYGQVQIVRLCRVACG